MLDKENRYLTGMKRAMAYSNFEHRGSKPRGHAGIA
jgi:hypothetical protein